MTFKRKLLNEMNNELNRGLLSYLEEFLVSGYQGQQVCKKVKEVRYSKGKACPHCNYELLEGNNK